MKRIIIVSQEFVLFYYHSNLVVQSSRHRQKNFFLALLLCVWIVPPSNFVKMTDLKGVNQTIPVCARTFHDIHNLQLVSMCVFWFLCVSIYHVQETTWCQSRTQNHGEILTEVRKYTSTPCLYDLVLMSISEYSIYSHSSTGKSMKTTGRWSPVFLSQVVVVSHHSY